MARKIDREALRQQINELQIDKELKHQLLEAISEKKRYGLVWEESSEEALDRMQEELPVFTEDVAKRLDSAPAGSPNHVLIEGDNLNALTALSYSHAGKIDVIYIDPPYNTGNKDFVYNDRFVDKEDGYRHSKWLSFMNRRLRIAKELLSEKGVIFISIDENEEAQLKILCDELFGTFNYLGTLTWESTTQPINAGKAKFQLQQKTEWILCYAKCKLMKDDFILKKVENTQKAYPHNGKLGACRLEIIEKSDAGQYKRDSMKFPILGHYPRPGKRWQIGLDTAKWLVENNRIEIIDGIVKKAVYPQDEKETIKLIPFWSFLSSDSVGSALKGKEELNSVFGYDVGFDTVKPVNLMKELLCHFKSDINILDFFAGSGTTLYATMQLNAEDGGNRKCILVQGIERDANGNENNICESVTYERNKRVIQGYTTPKGEQVAGLTANNLRYYRTTFVPREHSNRNRRALMAALVDLLCIKNDIYREQPTFGGKRFKPSVLRYFKDEAGQMLVVLDELAVGTIVPMISEVATKDNPLKVYVYSDGSYAFDDEFHDVMPVIELCAMPDAFLQALRSGDALPEQKYSEEAIAEFNANNAIAEQDKEAVAEALSDTYDYKE